MISKINHDFMKIPKQAKRVFKGVIFDVYQWPQKMYDGSIATFEKLKRPDTIQIIPVVGNKIVIAKEQQPDGWNRHGFIGGRVEPNETPLNAAKRELLEEAGLKAKSWTLYKVSEPYQKLVWHIYFFIAHDCKKIAEQKLDNGEKITTKEVTFDQFIEYVGDHKSFAIELTVDILKMKLDGTLNKFKKLLFKK